MKVYVVVQAVHLIGTASMYDFKDLSTSVTVCATREAAESTVCESIRAFVADFGADGCSTPEELESDYRAIMASRDGDTWMHEYCDRSAEWSIIESEVQA